MNSRSEHLAAAHVLEEVNARHGTTFELVAALPGGRQGGVWLVRSAVGTPLVFKYTDHPGLARRREQAIAAMATLRGRGYPTPAWYAAGVLPGEVAYAVQDLAPGEPATWATVPLDEVCAAIELQAGLGTSSGGSWSTFVHWAVHDEAGPRGTLSKTVSGGELVAHFDEVLDAYGTVVIPEGDLVHGDVNTSNLLVADGHLTALIDIDAIGPGTRAVDYAWLLREAFTSGAPVPDKELLREGGMRVAGAAVFVTCVAATAFDITVFEARGGHPHAGTPPAGLHALADFVRIS